MTLDEYITAAASTAEPRAYDLEYLQPGIIGEVGELFSEFAKQHWHESDRSATIVDEYGDICWLTAILLKRNEFGDWEVDTMVRRYGNEIDLDLEGALDLILNRAVSVCRSSLSQVYMRAAMLWDTLAQHCVTVTGQDLDTVLQRNIEKLAERSGKGELKTHA